jgi:hypothetical protein
LKTNSQEYSQNKRTKSILATYSAERNKKSAYYFTLSDMQQQLDNLILDKYTENAGSHRKFKIDYDVLYLSINEYIKNLDIKFVRPSLFQKIELIKRGKNNCTCHCGDSIKWSYDNKSFQKINNAVVQLLVVQILLVDG